MSTHWSLRGAAQRFSGNTLIRNTAYLAAGAGGSKALVLAVMPFLTRIYEPSDFGVMSVFSSCVLLAVPASTLKYSVAIPLPRSDSVALNLLMVCFASITMIAAAVFTLLYVFGDWFFARLDMPSLSRYAWLISLCVAGAGMYEVMSFWGTRTRQFKGVALTQLWQAILGSVLKIALGLAGFRPVGLLIGQSFQFAGGAVQLLLRSGIHRAKIASLVSLARMRCVAARYASFPQFRLPSQVLLAASAQAPMLFFATLYGRDETGHFGLAYSAVSIPVALVAQTISSAYYGEIARNGKTAIQQIINTSKAVLKTMVAIAILPTIGFAVFAPTLFGLVFGSEWGRAGEYAGALAVAASMQIIASPLLQIYNVFEHHVGFLVLNVLRLALVLVVFGVAKFSVCSPGTFIWSYAAVLSIFYACVVVTSLRYLSRLEVKGRE